MCRLAHHQGNALLGMLTEVVLSAAPVVELSLGATQLGRAVFIVLWNLLPQVSVCRLEIILFCLDF